MAIPNHLAKIMSFLYDKDLIPKINIVDSFDDKRLVEIGSLVYDEYRIDLATREKWERQYDEIFELADQIIGEKYSSGQVGAQVKYPILATAAISFSSRSYPNIVKGSDVVKHQVIGSDIDGIKAARGQRCSQHMNYQILEQMQGWEQEMDQGLIRLALIGSEFKKTYYNPIEGVPVSELVSAKDLVVNYHTKSIEKARRITHIIELYPNDIEERIRSGVFADFEYEKEAAGRENEDKTRQNEDLTDPDLPHEFLEQHRWLDLDDDGYKEPYIVTIHTKSKKVVRIVPRFGIGSVELNDDNEIKRIVADQYFTRFLFLPSFDAGFYGTGFGSLLFSPVNIINTLFNQLIDAGTLANIQGGFLGAGIKLKKGGGGGVLRFQQGEWKQISYMGDDIRRAVFALPAKEPSTVLFQLLGLMLEATKELASQADVLTGEHPKGNVPATTTLALIEQGLKVFSAIYKRVYLSLKSEFKLIRKLNFIYLSVEEYNNIIDYTEELPVVDPRTQQPVVDESGQPVTAPQKVMANPKQDYGDQWMDLIPVSGAANFSDTQSIIKAQVLMETRGMGLDDEAILRRFLEAMQVENAGELFPEGGIQPQPDPRIVLEEMKQKTKMIEFELRRYELEFKERESEGKLLQYWATSIKALADAEAAEAGPQLELYNQAVMAHQARLGYLKDLQVANMKGQNDTGTT